MSLTEILQLHGLKQAKETTLERAVFVLPLLMFVTAKDARNMFAFFKLSFFGHLMSP